MRTSFWKEAFKRTVPILCSYICIGAAYGMTMNEAGYPWYLSLLVSFTVYTGAFQFVLVSLLTGGASLGLVALTALLMNSRQLFYGLSFLEEFPTMGRWQGAYMIATLTDETYAVDLSLPREMSGRREVLLLMAFFSRLYWLAGTALGALLGKALPFSTEGVEFCMTALFIILLMENCREKAARLPGAIGGGAALICLLLFGGQRFMLPALVLVSALLLGLDAFCKRMHTGKREQRS